MVRAMHEIRFTTVVDCGVATDSWRVGDSIWNCDPVTREAGVCWCCEWDPGRQSSRAPRPVEIAVFKT